MPTPKDESLKYEFTYAIGGFNDGVEILPDKDGKVQVKISLYGGGQDKILKIGRLKPELDKLVRAYQVTATDQDKTAPEVTQALKDKLEELKTQLSLEIIKVLQTADAQIESAIKKTFGK